MSKLDDATQNMIRNLEEKTGKPFAEWLQIARASKLAKHGEIVKFLKTEHGLTHGYANLVAHKTLGSDAAEFEGDDLIADQYAGAKAALRPIYEALITAIKGFGDDLAPSGSRRDPRLIWFGQWLLRLGHGIVRQVAWFRHWKVWWIWARRFGLRDREIRRRGNGFRISGHLFPPAGFAAVAIVPLIIPTAGSPGLLTGTRRRMRSSFAAGAPRPSRFEVEK